MPRIEESYRFATREEAEKAAEGFMDWYGGPGNPYGGQYTISEDPPEGAFERRFLLVTSRWHSCD